MLFQDQVSVIIFFLI